MIPNLDKYILAYSHHPQKLNTYLFDSLFSKLLTENIPFFTVLIADKSAELANDIFFKQCFTNLRGRFLKYSGTSLKYFLYLTFILKLASV